MSLKWTPPLYPPSPRRHAILEIPDVSRFGSPVAGRLSVSQVDASTFKSGCLHFHRWTPLYPPAPRRQAAVPRRSRGGASGRRSTSSKVDGCVPHTQHVNLTVVRKPGITRWSARVSLALNFERHVAEFAPRKALKLIA